ncbi:hypothetical protein IPV09_07315 [Tessaracoccus sp. SD287]|uniref:WXG100-like domain-containing protein n=1 Tax=Tessaracoccus sp. SD287 TaxID=2782008 RepID=UPI001A95CAF8|nr:hypothetical protein [Tessaracoccus sp. SD287]MBO1031143.1 hypothetical protein [Tessaracoccus sp. SD287]
MALTLPGWLVEAMHYLGMDFPQSNEDALHQWADQLRSMSTVFNDSTTSVVSAISHVESHNEGPAVAAFQATASGADSDVSTLDRFAEGTEIAANGCEICAYAVVTLKGVVLFQLALMAPAIAAGPVAFLVKKGVEWAIGEAIGIAINEILGD